MSKKIFNPNDWATPTLPQSSNSFNSLPSLSSDKDIEIITKRIEDTNTDIAPNYADWRDLGFALADALGESGRTYYHRLSHFYSGYTETETNKQFDKCLKSNGNGVSIKTLYHLAKSAGVDISVKVAPAPKVQHQTKSSKSPNPQSEEIGESGEISCKREQSSNKFETMPSAADIEQSEMGIFTPTIPNEVHNNLPYLLQQIVSKADSSEDADLLLLGSMTVFSSCLPNIYGLYNQCEVYPNLFLFVAAKASAGKGRLSLCRRLVTPIHKHLREMYATEKEQYEIELSRYVATKNKEDVTKPQEPPLRTLFIPANNSATGLFQLLKENEEKGLIFETEGDTLAQTFKSEHGNYSDGFRKAFHHEPISYNRRKDREFVELAHPQLSALLSGTPRQVQSLIPDAENGLFSRFLFYYINLQPVWKNVFAGNENAPLEHQFDQIASDFQTLFHYMKQQPARLRFALSTEQQDKFNAYFDDIQKQYHAQFGDSFIGTIRRLGLSTFRMAMILTALRLFEIRNFPQTIICSVCDFQSAMKITDTLIHHAALIFQQLPTETPEQMPTVVPQQRLLQSLPQEFDRKKYLEVAKTLNIPNKTAEKQVERYLQNNLIERISHGVYRKR
ncbi:MAG: DUF3987 domain-containing protein [Prevotellaceae bacterium]|jgi:hypothetical protein|nr:DUF3987 domain-containing protein [Prevotellaceae bacterium]